MTTITTLPAFAGMTTEQKNEMIFKVKDEDAYWCEYCGEGNDDTDDVTDQSFDEPLRCDACGEFLENKLTPAGLASLRDEIANQQRFDAEGRTPFPYSLYLDFYCVELLSAPREENEE